MKVVVCDDDVTLRTVVSRLATEAGHTVLAETDSAADAVDMVVRFGAEILILDLSLPWGNGTRAVQELREAGSACQVVVFTSYAADSPDLRGAAVRAVIEKPDFEELERVLEELAGGVGSTGDGPERRKPIDPHPATPPPGPGTVSGLEDPSSFIDALHTLLTGDAVLVVHLSGVDLRAGWFERVAAADHLLGVARCLRAVLRAQDRLSIEEVREDERPEELVALLLSGGRPGVDSVFRRLETAVAASRLPGVVNGGWAMIEDGQPGGPALGRARDAARRSIGRPEGDRLWAG